ncbi:hypothetical protein JFV29_12000 [Peribacillus sp. TH16]|uniref:hypothetical protein n=1 Tax=Peribacillus sp. TH16 TaxID=2798482 RepID=UPI0019116F6C|nr:hypothetical protein [Peribacillus sp. TH16]MBK5482615.1 hypothetical protein [Peribacillus sp. TH16]
MINKTWKKVILIVSGIVITYIIAIVISAESIPYPTNQQLKEAEKVAERYIGENNGVEIINTSSSFTAEMFDRTIHIEGHSKENPKQVFRMDLDQVTNKAEKVTEKSINKICISNDGGKNFKCDDAEKLK